MPFYVKKKTPTFEWGVDKKLQLPLFTYSQFFPRKKTSFPDSGGSNQNAKCVQSIMFYMETQDWEETWRNECKFIWKRKV
jgi:Rieske Fe-S protein